MFYVLIFAILGIVLVVGVLMRNRRDNTPVDTAPHHSSGAEDASHTRSGSAERKERSRRRAQSKRDRNKHH